MFEYNNSKIWLKKLEDIEDGCKSQLDNLMALKSLVGHVAMMPDCHRGIGMPVGGVLALDNAVSPNAVGSDIGCGMCFVQTNIPVSFIKETDTPNGKLLNKIVGEILRNIPTGFNRQEKRQESRVLDIALAEHQDVLGLYPELLKEIQTAYNQIGTLGGGNHFIELQENTETGKLGLMLHSGSRHLGFAIHQYWDKITNENCEDELAIKNKLSYLKLDTDLGKHYWEFMKLAQDFAMENRQKMMTALKVIVKSNVIQNTDIRDISEEEQINCHHNYASKEKILIPVSVVNSPDYVNVHAEREVILHSKGATDASKDTMGIIPGAMGSYSYIVKGRGNFLSYDRCSHGAGRRGSRTWAKKEFEGKVKPELAAMGIVLGCNGGVDDEGKGAYKNIDEVMANQKDLVEIKSKMITIGVVKGSSDRRRKR